MKDKYLLFIVDDDPVYLQMLVELFSDYEQLEIRAFTNGEDCLVELRQEPDILIIDYFLNLSSEDARNGLQILEDVQIEKPDLNVIVLSGQLMPDVTFDFIFTRNVRNYIVKEENAFINLRKEVEKILDELDNNSGDS